MRDIVQEFKVYTLGELSKEAQQRAIEKRCEEEREFWEDHFLISYDFPELLSLLGINVDKRESRSFQTGKTYYTPAIYWRGFWSQGDGLSFIGDFDPTQFNGKKLRSEYPIERHAELHKIVNEFESMSEVLKRARIDKIWGAGNYDHECTIRAECFIIEDDEEVEAGAEMDDDATKTVRKLCQYMYARLEAAYTYDTSEESAREYLEESEAEFLEDGSVFWR